MTDENQTDVVDDAGENDVEQEVVGGEADVGGASGELEAERDRLKEQLLRTAADFDNFRKRTRRDVEDAERRGKEEALREVLPVIDNLERAVMAAEDAPSAQAVAEGVEMVLHQFEDAAGRVGLKRIPAVGERFDPSIHDAVQQLETSAHSPGAVVSEVVPGYTLGSRLLRPAMVVVAKPPSTSSESMDPGESTDRTEPESDGEVN